MREWEKRVCIVLIDAHQNIHAAMFISSLHQLPEEELERGHSIVPDH